MNYVRVLGTNWPRGKRPKRRERRPFWFSLRMVYWPVVVHIYQWNRHSCLFLYTPVTDRNVCPTSVTHSRVEKSVRNVDQQVHK